jgi:subtilisin family serine protease
MSTRLLICSLLLVLLLFVGTGTAEPSDGELQHVIVVMKERPGSLEGPAKLAHFASESQQDVVSSLRSMGAGEVTTLWSVNAFAAMLTGEQVKQVASRPDVARVVPDRVVTLNLPITPEKGDREMQFFKPVSYDIESITPSYPDEENIAWSVSWIEAPEVWANGFDGTGVTVAVVDTGIYADHPDLAGKVVGWADLVNYQVEPYDDHGHGTHCAGTIAGTGAGGVYTGVAPGADLIVVKVFNASGSALTSTVISGFEVAVELGADLISFSGGCDWAETFFWEGVVNSSEGIDLNFEVKNAGDGFDPSFILLQAEMSAFSDFELTMLQPDGSVYPGVHWDRDFIFFPSGYTTIKFIGDEALSAGEWTLSVAYPSLNESNMVWYSGKGNNLDDVLYQRFNLTDQMDDLDTLTFRMNTWYDMEDGWDYGYLEVSDPDSDSWNEIEYFNGVGSGIYTSDDLMDSIWYEDGCAYLDLRLRYETDESVVNAGWFVDWMAIPEIGFYDDASGDAGWEADPEDGWSPIEEGYPVNLNWWVYYTDNGMSEISQSANRIVENGTVFVTSAGNSGESGLRTIGGPAAAEKVIAVGATGSEEDYIAYYSSHGPSGWGGNLIIKPDVVAPGSSVISASTREGEVYRSMSGTSMACPHVAGVVALLLQVNPELDPEEIWSILTSTAVDLGPEGPDTSYGYGRVSAWAAVNALTALDPPIYEGPRLHAGFGYDILKIGEPNVITAISWDGMPCPGEPIHFLVWNELGLCLNSTVLTDASGMATASFMTDDYWYDYQVTDAHGNTVSGWITAEASDPVETLLIDMPQKNYQVLADSIFPLRYTIIDPQTMEPYAGDLRVIIRDQDDVYVNEVLTPVNGMIQLDIDGAEITSLEGSIELSPVADESQILFAGRISLYDYDETIGVLSPVITRAAPRGEARILVKEYSILNARPVRDAARELPVIWFYEADVRSLSNQFPNQMSRLLAGDVKRITPEYDDLLAEIEEMQLNITYVPYTLKNGIGKVDIPVPEGAYYGIVFGGGNEAFIVVDLRPFSHNGITPPSEPSRFLSVSAEWEGEYSPLFGSIVPGDLVHVTCYLEDPMTGSPVQGRVYLYTADQSAVVMTGADGYGYAAFPVRIRFEDAWVKNEIQIVGVSGDAYDYAFVYPPYEHVIMTGEYGEIGGVGLLTAGVSIMGLEMTDWPAIFEVSREDIIGYSGLPREYLSQSATLLSEHISGSAEYIDALPYGSYQTTVSLKDYFYRGTYSQGNWWSYYMMIGATPLIVETPPPERIGRAGPVDVSVRMAGGEAGVPV